MQRLSPSPDGMMSPSALVCQASVTSDRVSDSLASKPSHLDCSHIRGSQVQTVNFFFQNTWGGRVSLTNPFFSFILWQIKGGHVSYSSRWKGKSNSPLFACGLASVAAVSTVSSRNGSETQPDELVQASHMYSKAEHWLEYRGYCC